MKLKLGRLILPIGRICLLSMVLRNSIQEGKIKGCCNTIVASSVQVRKEIEPLTFSINGWHFLQIIIILVEISIV